MATRAILFFGLITLLTACSGQPKTTPTEISAEGAQVLPNGGLSQEEARADARTLINLLEQSHPDPYTAFGGKVAFEAAAKELLTTLPEGAITLEALALHFGAFLARLGDGHTHMLHSGDDSTKEAGLHLEARFNVSSEGIYLSHSSAPELEGLIGAQVVKVNHLGVEALVDKLSQATPIENRYHGWIKLSRRIADLNEMRALTPDGPSDHIVLEVLDRAGTPKEVLLKTPQGDGVKAEDDAGEFGALNSDSPYSFAILKDHGAVVLKVSDIMGREGYELAWRYGWGDAQAALAKDYQKRGLEMPEDMEEALAQLPSFFETADAALATMKDHELETLIVDLSGNGGGNTPMVFPFLIELYGDAFFATELPGYYITVYSQLYLDKLGKSVEQVREELNDPDFQVGDYIFPGKEPLPPAELMREGWLADATEKGFSYAKRLSSLGGAPLYTPKRVIVLCDAATYSAAFHFLFYLKHVGATVVGVPPGQSPNTFMEMTRFTLPNSGLEGSISNSAQVLLEDDPGARVFHPDFEVDHSTLSRYDFDPHTTLRFALDLLSSGQIKPNQPNLQ